MSDVEARAGWLLAMIGAPTWAPYFTVHGDPFVVDAKRPWPTSRVAAVSTAPADYGWANALFIGAAPSLVAELLGEIAYWRDKAGKP